MIITSSNILDSKDHLRSFNIPEHDIDTAIEWFGYTQNMSFTSKPQFYKYFNDFFKYTKSCTKCGKTKKRNKFPYNPLSQDKTCNICRTCAQ